MSIPTISSVVELEAYLQSKQLSWETCRLPDKDKISSLFPIKIPMQYADRINWKDPKDPLRLMILPDVREHVIRAYELIDPIGDTSHEPVPGLIHRYPDRCLLLFTTYCGVHCRFCFRREFIGKPRLADIPACLDYLRAHAEIREVIFSGGDPATFPEGFLFSIVQKLVTIPHLKLIRFHTRALVMDPTIISPSWIHTLAQLHNKHILFVLHINHPNEITPKLLARTEQLRVLGMSILSQSVLLKGVNDSVEVLEQLFTQLSSSKIKPYYLHHLDFARGTHHFRVSIAQGQALFSALRGRISGHCIPEYVLDLPGGDGKYPVMWLKELEKGKYQARSFDGQTIEYSDPY